MDLVIHPDILNLSCSPFPCKHYGAAISAAGASSIPIKVFLCWGSGRNIWGTGMDGKSRARKPRPAEACKVYIWSVGKMVEHRRMPRTASARKHVLMGRGDRDRMDSMDPGIRITYQHTNVTFETSQSISVTHTYIAQLLLFSAFPHELRNLFCWTEGSF